MRLAAPVVLAVELDLLEDPVELPPDGEEPDLVEVDLSE